MMARTGKKHNMTAYLAGAIEATDDKGRTWREHYRKELAAIGVDAWIPNDLNMEHELTMEQWIVLRSKDDLTEFKTEFRKRIIGPDIAAVDAADVIIVRWNGERTTGTAHEVGRAYMRGQMVYLVTPRPFREVPAWMLACVEAEFHDFEKTRRVSPQPLWPQKSSWPSSISTGR
jgi:nucleoside 2-deoxyribosyltransferase